MTGPLSPSPLPQAGEGDSEAPSAHFRVESRGASLPSGYMSQGPLIPVRDLLARPGTPFARALHHSRYVRDVAAAVARALARPLRDHCLVANVRGDCLVLQVDSPSWATRLRFELPSLLASLRAHRDLRVSHATVRVHVARGGEVTQEPVPAKMSAAAAACLQATAQSVAHPDLRSAILRLARHGTVDA